MVDGIQEPALGQQQLTAPGSAAEELPAQRSVNAQVPASVNGSRSLRRLVGVVALVAALVVLLGLSDWYLRNREMGQLLDAVEASEAAMNDANHTIGNRLEEVEPSTSLTEQDRLDLRADLSDVASHGAAQILTTGDAVSEVTVMPWHRAILNARTKYLAHSHAWQSYLSKSARDPDEVFKRHPEISGTFLSAERSFRKATPLFPLHRATARMDAIFASS